MKTLLQKIQKNYLVTILTVIGLGILIFFLSKIISGSIIELLKKEIAFSFYTKNVIFKFFMIVFSIIAMVLLKKGDWKFFGFNKPGEMKYWKFFLKIIGIFIASLIIFSILFVGVLNHIFPKGEVTGFPEPDSYLEFILTVWIWSSLAEEIFCRGLLQSLLSNLKHIKFLRLSIPVIISGLFFGAMHLTLLNGNMGFWFVMFIVFNASVIGFVVAYYREKTGSLLIAFLIHFTANVVGYLPVFIKLLIA